MKRLLLITSIFLAVSSNTTGNTDINQIGNSIIKKGSSWVDGSVPITLISNVNRQAEAWGFCSATWTVMANLPESTPAQSTLNNQFSNGAKVALAMTYIADLSDDFDPKELKSTWIFAKTVMESIPEVQLNWIMADLEEKGADTWVDDLIATKQVCEDNLDGQQMYVDLWRGLATSGLLEFK